MHTKILFIILNLLFTLGYTQTCLTQDQYPNEWQNSRYTDNRDETITDKTTNLMWKKCSEGLSGNDCGTGSATTMNWQAALALGGSSFAGHSDWRLPNMEELRSLVAYNCYNPSINETMFPNTPASSYFWSSSPYAAYYKYAWGLGFYRGDSDYYGPYRTYSYRVRLVRDSR